MKIVINTCYGGFGLSRKAQELYLTKKGYKYEITSNTWGDHYKVEGCPNYYISEVSRDDPVLIEVVEELGEEADDRFSRLHIVEIPDDVAWEISEYDGMEHVAECHRTWY